MKRASTEWDEVFRQIAGSLVYFGRVPCRSWGLLSVDHSAARKGSGPVHLTLTLIVMKGHVSASVRPLYNSWLFSAPLLQKVLMHSLWPFWCKSNIWPQISQSCTELIVYVWHRERGRVNRSEPGKGGIKIK